MFTPSLEGASRSEGVKDVTHSLEGCDLLLIAPLTYNCNIIGAFKNGTHPTSPRLGFGCQVELRNLTYNSTKNQQKTGPVRTCFLLLK